MSKTVAISVVEAKSVWEKSIGLINKNPMAMLFRTRFGIHTFGMRYPIDVVILDAENHVVKIKHALQPNRLFFWPVRYTTVLELPEHTIKHLAISLGDTIRFTTL